MVTTRERLDIAFKWASGPLLDEMRRLMSTLESRFTLLEKQRADYSQAIIEVQEVAVERINETLGPAIDRMSEVAEFGFLIAYASPWSVTLTKDARKLFLVNEGSQRGLFTPTSYVTIERQLAPDTRAIGRVVSYDKENGELLVDLIEVMGPAGPHTDWTITASPGVSEFTKRRAEDAETAAAAANVARDLALAAQSSATISAGSATSANTDAQTARTATLAARTIAEAARDQAVAASGQAVGAVVGKQDLSPKLSSLAALSLPAGQMLFTSAADTLATLAVPAFFRTFMASGNAAALRAYAEAVGVQVLAPAYALNSNHAIPSGLYVGTTLTSGPVVTTSFALLHYYASGTDTAAQLFVDTSSADGSIWWRARIGGGWRPWKGLVDLFSPALTGIPTAPSPNRTSAPAAQVATSEYVIWKIDDLIAASPGTLNTLNELAAALGDDPNFATTITNALALKAPLASPALTGNPTAPVQGASDDSSRIANTSWVNNAITTAVAPKAPLASPGLSGAPTSPTPAQSDASNRIATTQYVTAKADTKQDKWTNLPTFVYSTNVNFAQFVIPDGTVELLMQFSSLSHSSGSNQSLEVWFSEDNGSTWALQLTILTAIPEASFVQGSLNAFFGAAQAPVVIRYGAAIGVSGVVTDMKSLRNLASAPTHVRVVFSAGQIDAGTVKAAVH